MRDYTANKAPKDSGLCRTIRKTITLQKKEIGLTKEEVAHELGMSLGYLDNKLTPSMTTNDLSITEFMHFLELTGDYAALEYIANKFDMVMIDKKHAHSDISDLNSLVDMANIENNDVFAVVKKAIADGSITEEEAEAALKEIDEAQKANAELKDAVLSVLRNIKE